MDIASKLRKLVTSRGYESDVDYARHLRMQQQTVSNWLNGERVPKLPTLLLLAKDLGVTVDYLIDDERGAPDDRHAADPGVVLSRDDERILMVARELGYPDAMARLLGKPEGRSAANVGSGGLTPTVVEESRKSGRSDGSKVNHG